MRIYFFNTFSVLFIEIYINNYIENNDKKIFIKFINYYRKFWLNYKQLWGDLTSEINFTKTNNPCENFYRRLNELIFFKNPKIYYLVDNLFLLSKKYYLNYITNLGSPNKKIKNCLNLHLNTLNEFKTAIDSFLEHKQLNKLFENKYYLEITEKNEFNDLDNYYFDEENEN